MMVVLPQLAPPGLSPRVRGEELILGPRALLRGIIPAGAGRRGRVDDLQSGVEDHPRGGAFRGLADTRKGTVAKPLRSLATADLRLADTGKGTVAKPTGFPTRPRPSLADTGKGTVAKPLAAQSRVCRVLPTLEKELWQSEARVAACSAFVLPTLEKELWQSLQAFFCVL